MFGLFTRKKAKPSVDKQAVIVSIDLTDHGALSQNTLETKIRYLEEGIKLWLPEGSEFGEDIASDEATLYIYGQNADAIFKIVGPLLKNSEFHHIDITLSYGPADDPETIKKKFTL